MYYYSLTQWLLFFYIYCFIGWIWECSYVTVKEGIKTGKWSFVNRGFMHGPYLPIYGSGAIVVLLATLPVKNNYIATFFMGMIMATLLEYFTGAMMEHLFKVRYWDYSTAFLNIKGYVCLGASIGWGIFSLLMVNFIHKPFERVVLKIPETVGDIAAFGITVIFMWDLTQSFNEAMDMRRMIEKLTESNEKLKHLAKSVELNLTFASEEIKSKQAASVNETLKRNERLQRNITEFRERRKNQWELLSKKASEKMLNAVDDIPGIQKIIDEINAEENNLMERTQKRYYNVARHLRRNPTASSRKYSEALEQIQALFENNKKNKEGENNGTNN